MEEAAKESEKVVIAKPIARKPRFSNSKSFFPDHLSSPITASPSVIRPKTVRLRPSLDNNAVAESHVLKPKACSPSNNASESDVGCSSNAHVVYKPLAKLVSKRTVSLLENFGTNCAGPNQDVAEVAPCLQLPSQAEPTSDFHRTSNAVPEINQDSIPEVPEDVGRQTSLLPPNSSSHQPCDQATWRKYGQKQVKGSEYPRSYYRCTYPNCPVKKKVEKTSDGQIAEVVYKGEHDHSKVKDSVVVDGQKRGPACDATQREDNLNRAVESSTISASSGLNRECPEVNESAIEAESNGFRTKRRKRGDKGLKASRMEEGSTSEPRFVVKKDADSDKVGDGYRWRKYGQKVVKGNPYPRSYYRCTSPKCNVKKYVERTSEDPGAFITTYEGRHSHDMPAQSSRKS